VARDDGPDPVPAIESPLGVARQPTTDLGGLDAPVDHRL
jgi:hypothetical protein